MSSIYERLTRSLVRKGVREGLLGGNGRWLAAGALAWLVRFLRKKPQPRVVTEKLRLGESIVVTSVAAPPFGRRARRLGRAEREVARAEAKQVQVERRKAKLLGSGRGREAEHR